MMAVDEKQSSRRQKGEELLENEEPNNQTLKRELDALSRTGGSGGRVRPDDNKWEYFPIKRYHLSRKQRFEQNKDVLKKHRRVRR